MCAGVSADATMALLDALWQRFDTLATGAAMTELRCAALRCEAMAAALTRCWLLCCAPYFSARNLQGGDHRR
jgi:hypothetical protein